MELVDTAVIEDLPGPWGETAETVPEEIEHEEIVSAGVEATVDGEFLTEAVSGTDDEFGDDLLLLEELTRPELPSIATIDAVEQEPAPAVSKPAAAAQDTPPAAEVAAPAVPTAVPTPVAAISTPEAMPPGHHAHVEAHRDADRESAGEQIVALQAELAEKDELVAVLTAQLEEAANRLDRLHRAGADRAPRRGGASLSAEALERQSELSDQVARLADSWEEWRAADPMAELGRKLDELCQLVSQSARPAAASPRDGSNSRFTDSWSGDFQLPPPPTEKPLPKWEQMKAQLLGDSTVGEQSWDLPPPAETPVPAGSQAEIDLGIVAEPVGEPPAAVEVDSADLETLRRAVEERDEFISQLLRRLRSSPACRREPIDWEAIANAPDDLRQRLQELEGRFQELLRIEECDMSLERARLARERARLEQLRRELEKHGVRGNGAASTENDDSRRERRWLRVFSFGGKRDDDLD